MNTQNLYDKLKAAYNETNLNNITLRIVELYRSENFETILKIGRNLKDFIELDFSKANRLFNQLIMLYHPDKLNYYNNMFEKYYKLKDNDKLNHFMHIFTVLNALKDKPVLNNFDYNNLYNSQVQYGLDEDDFDSITLSNSMYSEWEIKSIDNHNNFCDFLWAVQKKEKINFNINSPYFYLEQLEGELDLSNSNIIDLNGIEYCINITSLDLSQNQIIDISSIKELVFLESIYLANNNISDIDVLSELINLKYIDLSFNDIVNIKSLFELNNLEYLNVIGNNISAEQINKFRKSGVVFVD